MKNLNSLEERIRNRIESCMGIEQLRLGRLEIASDDCRERNRLGLFWIVLVSSSPGLEAEFVARLDFATQSTILLGTAEKAARIDQQERVEFDLDRTVTHPDFSCSDDDMPTELGGVGPDFCRVIVRTWKCLARYDLLGSKA